MQGCGARVAHESGPDSPCSPYGYGALAPNVGFHDCRELYSIDERKGLSLPECDPQVVRGGKQWIVDELHSDLLDSAGPADHLEREALEDGMSGSGRAFQGNRRRPPPFGTVPLTSKTRCPK